MKKKYDSIEKNPLIFRHMPVRCGVFVNVYRVCVCVIVTALCVLLRKYIYTYLLYCTRVCNTSIRLPSDRADYKDDVNLSPKFERNRKISCQYIFTSWLFSFLFMFIQYTHTHTHIHRNSNGSSLYGYQKVYGLCIWITLSHVLEEKKKRKILSVTCEIISM